MPVEALFTIGLAALAVGAAASLVAWRSPAARVLACGLAICGTVFQAIASAATLVQGTVTTWSLPFGIPVFSWTVRLDALSAYFCLALAVLASAVSVYSLGYLRGTDRNTGVLGFFYNLLLLSRRWCSPRTTRSSSSSPGRSWR